MKSHITILRKQIVAFILTGSFSTLIMFILYICLYKRINYQYSYLIAYSISVIALYFMNLWFVFKKHISLRSALLFPFIYLLQYLVGAASLEILARLGVTLTYAPLIVVIIMLPVTFLLNRIVYQSSFK